MHPDSLHTTLVYHDKSYVDIPVYKEYPFPVKAVPVGFQVWDAGNGISKCLVLTMNSRVLSTRHDHLQKHHNLNWSHPSYIPHVTLSYNIGTFDVGSLPSLADFIGHVGVTGETIQLLNSKWSPDLL